MSDTIEEFNKDVGTYLRRFEELRSLMSSNDPHLTVAYFVSSFLSVLGEDLRPMVKMIRPRTVEQVVERAKLQEMVVEALLKKQRVQQQRTVHSGNWQQGGNSKGVNKEMVRGNIGGRNFVNSNLGGRPNDLKRQPGACYRCGDRYFPGHKSKRQLLLLEGRGEGEA